MCTAFFLRNVTAYALQLLVICIKARNMPSFNWCCCYLCAKISRFFVTEISNAVCALCYLICGVRFVASFIVLIWHMAYGVIHSLTSTHMQCYHIRTHICIFFLVRFTRSSIVLVVVWQAFSKCLFLSPLPIMFAEKEHLPFAMLRENKDTNFKYRDCLRLLRIASHRIVQHGTSYGKNNNNNNCLSASFALKMLSQSARQ